MMSRMRGSRRRLPEVVGGGRTVGSGVLDVERHVDRVAGERDDKSEWGGRTGSPFRAGDIVYRNRGLEVGQRDIYGGRVPAAVAVGHFAYASEFQKISDADRSRLLEVVVDQVDGRVPFVESNLP